MSVPLLIPSRPYVKWAYFEVVYNEVVLAAFLFRVIAGTLFRSCQLKIWKPASTWIVLPVNAFVP